MVHKDVAPFDAATVELDGNALVTDGVATADDETKVDVVNPEEAVTVAERELVERTELEGVPIVIVERIVVPEDPLESVRDEGTGIEDVADASGEEKEPLMLSRVKKDE
jgi:hypothetical protein